MSTEPHPPDYSGGSLLNLVAELERRLTGNAPSIGLHPELAAVIPEADTYVLLLFDGLGDHQLDHPAAGPLRDARRAAIDAPFPTTTTVSLATVSTGLAPSQHGLVGHLMWLPEVGEVVNTLKWLGKGGHPAAIDTTDFLPSPNLWERVNAAGFEAIVVQPGEFSNTPLTKALYRGARFEAAWNVGELTDAITSLAAVPGRLIFGYLPQVDFAAHLFGQNSPGYREAMEIVARAWEVVSRALPRGAAMVGTADHGHLDYNSAAKQLIDRSMSKGLNLFGDPRALYARGPADRLSALGNTIAADWHPIGEIAEWWGPGPDHPGLADRAPNGVFLADPGCLLLPGHMDRRLTGYHGGLLAEEIQIPLLISD